MELDDTICYCFHISKRKIVNFIRVFAMLLADFPVIQMWIDERIQRFIETPNQRYKASTPSLGDILVFALFSSKYRLKDVL